MNGADLKPFTRSTMGVKEEEGCHTDMHKLEDRGLEGAPRAAQVALGGQRARGRGVKGQRLLTVCAAEDPAVCCGHRALSQRRALETKGRHKK